MNNQSNGNNQNNYYGNQPNGSAPDGYYNNQPYGNNPNGYYNNQSDGNNQNGYYNNQSYGNNQNDYYNNQPYCNNPNDYYNNQPNINNQLMVGNQGYYNDNNYGYDNSYSNGNDNYINVDIPDKSENKPNSPKKKKVWKILLKGIESIIESIVAIMFLIFIVDKINDEGPRTTVIQTYGNNSSRVQQQETDNDNVISYMGDSVVSNGIKFTLDTVYKSKTIYNKYNNIADDGKIYIVMFFDVENVGSKSHCVNYYSFDSNTDGYMVDNDSWVMGEIDGVEILFGDITPGNKRKGYVVYEIPENWNNLEMHYSSYDGVDFYCSLDFDYVSY